MTNFSSLTGSTWENDDFVGIVASETDADYTNAEFTSDACGKFTVSEGFQPIIVHERVICNGRLILHSIIEIEAS